VIRAFLVVASFAGAFALPAFAAEPPAASATRVDGVRQAPARVVVFNRAIVRFRASLLGLSPEDRAEGAADRIRAMLRAGARKVTVEQRPEGADVLIDGQLAFTVTPDDVERLGERTMMTAATDAARRLERVIAEMDEARNPRALLVNGAWATGATLVWLIAIWLLRRGLRLVGQRALRYADARGAELRAAGTAIVPREQILHWIRIGINVLLWALALLATYEWLGFVLSQFPFTRPWGEGLADFLIDTTVGMLSAVANSVPGLVVAVVIFMLARAADGMARGYFDAVQAGRTAGAWVDADSARPTRRLVTIAIWVFAVAMAYPYIPGSETDAFKGLSVLLGLMVSVGASGIVAQAASGMILMYTRTFRPGEYVRIGDSEGTVVVMGTFTTRIRTGMGEELTVPNSMVLGTVTRNYSRTVHGAGFIVDATVTIGYDAPWRQVHAMLIEAARRTTGVLADPAPRVYQTALSDFYAEYRLVCQAVPSEPRPRAEVLSALHANIQDTFNEHGVQIMSPHYFMDPQAPKIVPPERWHTPPAPPPRA
jgi:small-conductance mechanosensitive channel